MTQDIRPPPGVIDAYDLDPASIRTLAGGLINKSFAVTRRDGSASVLQCLNRIFTAEVNEDLDAVTRHLAAKGLETPKLIRTRADARDVTVDGLIWRLLSRIEGETHETLVTDAEAAEAGRVLGGFHQAIADYRHPLQTTRPPIHELDRHLQALRRALDEHESHGERSAVARLADRIFDLAGQLEALPTEPKRIVHGDPKISNVIFREGRAVCLIDLDTLTRTSVALELGDALRSWCNPAGEDSLEASISIERFRLALEAYAANAPELLAPHEWLAIPNAALTIAIELAARFAADALNESYFSWDPKRFTSASRHNQTRASSQLALAADIERRMPALDAIVVTLT